MQAWNTMIAKLADKSMELPTVHKTKKKPVWFSASIDGNMIYIGQAINNRPS